MKSLKIAWAFIWAVNAVIVLHSAAVANYILPPVDEDYTVIPDSWKLTKSNPAGDFDRLEAVHNGKAHVWTIDRFLLAARTDSNTICTGSYMTFTKGYLEQLSASPAGTTIRVEVVGSKKDGSLEVAGVWSVDFRKAWERAIQQGSRVLNISAEQVRALKSPEAYESKLREFSKQQWDLIGSR
jgi:hypothetical protein